MKTHLVFGLLLTLILQASTATERAVQQSPAQPAGPDLQARAKVILADMAAGNFAKVEPQYNPAVAATLPPGKLSYVWKSLESQVGAFQRVTDTKVTEVQGFQVVALISVFERATLDILIGFDAEGRIGGLRFTPHLPEVRWESPSYVKPGTFLEQGVFINFSHWRLPGTLSFPARAGPFPAVVLVQGSGPHDQDESLGANKPFKDLAWGLASRGVAVLRYVKRTQQYGAQSSDDPAALTVNDETVDDARAAVALLAAHPKIDPKRIYVLGHSLGAYLGPRIASGDAKIAGLILLAGNTRPMGELIAEQVRYLAGVKKLPAAEAQKQVKAAEVTAREIARSDLKPTDVVDVLGTKIPGAYWLDLRGYDPAAAAAKLSLPLLVLQGERDYQVRMTDFEGWKKALGKKKTVTLKSYPGLNHLFQAGSGFSTPAEYDQPGHVAEEVILDIAGWVLAGGKIK